LSLALLAPVEESPETDFPCIEKHLPKLNPNYQELIKRADLRAEKRTNISNDLGLSPNTLRVKLHRSRQALGRQIKLASASCYTECDLHTVCRASAHQAKPALAQIPLF
jgi:DNA-directed RNA polymerase specialized sigma24 family protein